MSGIKIVSMTFQGILSYRDETHIDFAKFPVVQLVGKNGSGKSSIAAILEEALYNKNTRGFKKDELFCWTSDSKEYRIKVLFEKDGKQYVVDKHVKSTAKLTFTENGENIGGHTTTQTYKVIEDVIGCDFTTFTKLIYQSVGSSLDFLKATDATRKQFLISLMSLEEYKENSEKFKTASKEVKDSVTRLQGASDAKSTMLESTKAAASKPERPLEALPESIDETILEEIVELSSRATLAEHHNATIKASQSRATKQNEREKMLTSKVNVAQENLDNLKQNPVSAAEPVDTELKSVTTDLLRVSTLADTVKARYKSFKAKAEATNCPTCGQHMDVSDSVKATNLAKDEFYKLHEERTELETKVKELRALQELHNQYFKYLQQVSNAETALTTAEKNLQQFYNEAEEFDLTLEPIEVDEINVRLKELKRLRAEHQSEVDRITTANRNAELANARITAAKEDLESISKDYADTRTQLDIAQKELSELQILEKSFKDLISYKLEHSVKVFEELINDYLSSLTNGSFALGFELNDTKLQVIIYKDGTTTSMTSCSTGQQQRIQLATLLAIRKLMGSISKVNINLLFLDEVISFLDPDGMSVLIELLLEEHDLNSILVSHGMTHPLTTVFNIVSEDGSTRIELDG